MNRLKIMEIKQRRHEERRQKALVNGALRSPIGRPIAYILDKQNRLLHHASNRHHRNSESKIRINRVERVSLTLLPTGYKASRMVYKGAFPNNEASEFSHLNFPVLPQQPTGPLLPNRKKPSTGGEVPTQPLNDAEKRDRLFIKAVEIISEWTAEEPNFIDPEAAYGDKNFRFMDSVKVRLRAFKATISPNMMKILENASIRCKRTPRNDTEIVRYNKATDKTHINSKQCTPTGNAHPKTQSAIMPRKSTFVQTLSSPAHYREDSCPEIQFRPGNNEDHLPRISPAVMRNRTKPIIDPEIQPCQTYQQEMSIIERTIPPRCFEEVPGCSRRLYHDSDSQNCYINRNYWEPSPRYRCNMRSYDVDLDSHSSSRWPPYRGLDIEHPEAISHRINKPCGLEEEKEEDASLTASLLHPIWDTPEECKMQWSNFMLLE
ncbi:unnamed protein product [Rodentolepis nana]|uniref:Uncharacterized protein n=1 Tax=Rodentolepis nana TaxID=102285 RepID=A0A0R3T253_RODNA|nr:unnamed protein product [Rodentolepis nana]